MTAWLRPLAGAGEFPEPMYQYERPFVSDARRFEAAFGPLGVTPHEDDLRATLEWFRSRV